MAKLAVIRTIQVRPGFRAPVLEAVNAHRLRCLRDEPGTIQFDVMVPVDDQTKLILYEVYVDDAAIVAHMKGESMVKVREQIGSKILSINGVHCTFGADGEEPAA
ncbi:hypothetical protein BH11PSE11_BH11PSE11_17850 [soil metagenome]